MSKKKFLVKPVIAVLILFPIVLFCQTQAENRTTYTFEKVAESEAFFDMGFVSADRLAIDAEENVFILDIDQHKIAKLDKGLRFKKIFGAKGQGPGEFNSGYSISIDRQGNVCLYEAFNKVIRYSGEGKLVDEIRISRSINGFFGFVLDHPVYVMSKREHFGYSVKAIVSDISNKKVIAESELIQSGHPMTNSSSLGPVSLPAPFVAGHTFTDVYDGYCVVGEGERFFVRLFDSSGKQLASIKKELKARNLTSKERDFLVDSLYDEYSTDHFSRKDLRKTVEIYEAKNFISNIKISKNRIYVFTVPDDITTTKQHFPVEIYDFSGKLIAMGLYPKIPRKIYGEYAYYEETIQEEDEEISKLVKYRIVTNR